MNVQAAMTKGVETVPTTATIEEAAQKMRVLDVGFIPVSDAAGERLEGTVTDRDIAVRCVAAGQDPSIGRVDSILTDQTLYCYAGDDIGDAAESMAREKVYRLLVLDDAESKNLVGVVTLNDIMRHGKEDLARRVSRVIAEG